MSPHRLLLQGVRHVYPTSGFTLEVERLELRSGEVLVLTGPSGSGKSTLLALAAGVIEPNPGSAVPEELTPAGELWLEDQALHGTTEAARRRMRLSGIGQVLQDLALIEYLSALENVVLPARLAGHDPKAAIERATQLLDRLGLSGKHRRRPSRLSGGEQQRVALARALIVRPGLILADEPTGSLDPRTAREAAELLVKEARQAEAALLFTTHDPSLVDLATQHVELRSEADGVVRLFDAKQQPSAVV